MKAAPLKDPKPGRVIVAVAPAMIEIIIARRVISLNKGVVIAAAGLLIKDRIGQILRLPFPSATLCSLKSAVKAARRAARRRLFHRRQAGYQLPRDA